jgi:hypothetical protein
MMRFVCRICDDEKLLDVTIEQLKAWRNGMLIQDAMPHLSPGDRELLISGICGSCFDELFPKEEA